MKRNLLLLFALVAFISASADKDIYQDQLLFHCFDDGTAEVRCSDYHDTREMDIVIPETVEADGKTYTVTSIGDKVFGYEINSITLPNTIRRIGNYAFYGSGLTSITLPESLEEIGEGAFKSMGLSTVTIPEGVKEISKSAFQDNESLTTVVLPSHLERIGESAFRGCSSLASISFPSTLKSIGSSAFSSNFALASIHIPEGVEEIGEEAFQFSGLTSLTLPKGIKKVPYGLLSSCIKLTEVVIQDGVKEIGWYAFNGCTKLVSVTLPEGLESIGEGAFQSCGKLTSIELPSSLTTIGGYSFGTSGLVSLTLPAALKSIGYRAFVRCKSLKSLVIPQSVERIGADIVSNCAALVELQLPQSLDIIEGRIQVPETAKLTLYGEGNALEISSDMIVNNRKDGTKALLYASPSMAIDGVLTIPGDISVIGDYALENYEADKIVLPEGVTHIGVSTFSNSAVKEVNLPSSLKTMGQDAFYTCERLERIAIPEGIEVIPGNCFFFCTSLSSLTLPSSLKTLDDFSLCGCSSLTTLDLPEGLETIGIDALLLVGITELTIPSSCTKFNLSGQKQLKKVTLPAGMTELPMNAFRRMTSLESVVLPAGITAIPSNLFSGCTSLKSLTIPEGVKTIGEAAFAESGIESIVIPESVEKIDDKTFQGCPNLESIDIKAPINSLPDFFAFECPNLKSVSLPEGLEEIGFKAFVHCSSLTEVSLPSTVKNMKYAAFAQTGLESVSLPDGIEHVGEFCFQEIAAERVDLSNTSLTEMYRGLFVKAESLKEVILPASLKILNNANFLECASLTTVKCLAQEPPLVGEPCFEDAVKTSATLYVLDASLAAYKSANVWKDFFAVKGLTATGLSSPEAADDGTERIYDLNGRMINESSVKGVYIKNGKKYVK